MPTIAFLGAGAMGEALTRGLLNAKIYAPSDIILYGPNRARVQSLAADLRVRVAASPEEMAIGADVLVVAVKPHMIETALTPLRDAVGTGQIVVSVAAGVPTARLEACFAQDVPVVRAMPNTPSMIGEGATALCAGQFAGADHVATAKTIFGAVGLAVEVDEKQMDAVTGLSGSGPAYVFLFIEALADGGVRAGLPRAVALKLATQTVLGSAKMLLETGEHPGALKDRVASPGGTTIAGIHALEAGAFRGITMDAVLAAAKRAKELG